MRRGISIFCFITTCILDSYSQTKSEMKKLVYEAFQYATDQYKYMMTQLPNGIAMP